MPLVEGIGVHKSFGALQVLRDVHFSVDRGETVCIIGPSGSGKSTLLRCINHLEQPDDGMIKVDGHVIGFRQDGRRLCELSPREVMRQRCEIGMVFQQFNLFPHMTATENVAIGPRRVRGLKKRSAIEKAQQQLEVVGLGDKLRAYPRELSGGQQQRVGIARALAMDPKLMLFDEPTSALDPELVREVLDVMSDLARGGMTMMVVTHEMGFAREAGDTIYFMHEGQIVERGRPRELLDNPEHPRTRDFLSHLL
jgi:polar amino acid transport system ATP-binding protein